MTIMKNGIDVTSSIMATAEIKRKLQRAQYNTIRKKHKIKRR